MSKDQQEGRGEWGGKISRPRWCCVKRSGTGNSSLWTKTSGFRPWSILVCKGIWTLGALRSISNREAIWAGWSLEASVFLQLEEGCRRMCLQSGSPVFSMWEQMKEVSLCRGGENGKARRHVGAITDNLWSTGCEGWKGGILPAAPRKIIAKSNYDDPLTWFKVLSWTSQCFQTKTKFLT